MRLDVGRECDVRSRPVLTDRTRSGHRRRRGARRRRQQPPRGVFIANEATGTQFRVQTGSIGRLRSPALPANSTNTVEVTPLGYRVESRRGVLVAEREPERRGVTLPPVRVIASAISPSAPLSTVM